MDSVLLMMAWEDICYGTGMQGLTKEDVASWYSLQNSHRWRLRNQFHPRLKTWNSGTPPIPPDEWLNIAAKTRSRIVHMGYIPNLDEALQVLYCYDSIVEFTKSRLSYGGNRGRYPRTCGMILGERGLVGMGCFNGRMKRMYEDEGNRRWMEEFMEFRDEVLSMVY